MTGKELAGKLKDMGFTQVKSHMSALDEFEVLEVQAKLEAYGIIGESTPKSEGEDLGGGLIVRRKKKKVEATSEPETKESFFPDFGDDGDAKTEGDAQDSAG